MILKNISYLFGTGLDSKHFIFVCNTKCLLKNVNYSEELVLKRRRPRPYISDKNYDGFENMVTKSLL